MDWTLISKIGGAVAGVGVIATGAWQLAAPAVVQELDKRHALKAEFESYRSEADSQQHVNAIQSWVRAAREEGASEGICDALRAELAALCTERKDHYLCKPEMFADTLKRAGCN